MTRKRFLFVHGRFANFLTKNKQTNNRKKKKKEQNDVKKNFCL